MSRGSTLSRNTKARHAQIMKEVQEWFDKGYRMDKCCEMVGKEWKMEPASVRRTIQKLMQAEKKKEEPTLFDQPQN